MSIFLLRVRGVFFACVLFCAPYAVGETLENGLWRVEVVPSTLAIRVQPMGEAAVQVSSGVDAHPVSQLLNHGDGLLTWHWDKGDEGAWQVQARLVQRELLLTIKARDPGVLQLLRQPGDAMGKALIWPLAEGHYVPRGDPVWQRFLLEQGELNTTQDMSLPLWGMDHGAFTLTWLMTQPFNNRVQFAADKEALAISASHEFTSLDTDEPMTFRLYLGEGDPLAGARRYREWLIENGRYETLQTKLAASAQSTKLPGAAHVYLWGNDLLGADDVRSWPRLLATLASAAPLASQLRVHVDREASAILAAPPVPLERWQQIVVLRSLNHALNSLARDRWRHATQVDMQQLASHYSKLRAQVAQVFADALTAQPSTWGGTFSQGLIARLQGAGLSRLWIGLGEGWEGGLWHPEAVRAAVQAGYLIAPYDSYQTALPADENASWTTAHLGRDAHRDCAIMLRDGRLKSGFQQSGHYTDPRCVRPVLEARVQAIQQAAGFNSWFLDAYATGMVFNSYHPVAPMTQAQNAEANVDASRWVSTAQGLPTGSEDGNAVTAQGVLFAHGMQTPVIGWGDPELAQNTQSPWYLGKWFPPEQPAVFFKQVPIKEPYRTVHFGPTTRLPLYQSVFHGAVITTHHWLFDSLKLTNVRVQNELTQLLYNVPPLYHLSHSTLNARLPLMQRQDAFFRPLHERLATQAMTGFTWLTGDRLVQQTTFSDGTRLVANFDGAARAVAGESFPAHSVTAVGPDGVTAVYHPEGT